MNKEIKQAIDKGLNLKKEKEAQANIEANKKAKALLKIKEQKLMAIRKEIKDILKELPAKITNAIAEGKDKLVVITKCDEGYDYDLWRGLENKLRKMGLDPFPDSRQLSVCVRYDPDAHESYSVNEIYIRLPK